MVTRDASSVKRLAYVARRVRLLQELEARRVIRILDIDGKVNPADALTKHLDKSTWLGYMTRMYNTDMSTVPTSVAQPRSAKGCEMGWRLPPVTGLAVCSPRSLPRVRH